MRKPNITVYARSMVYAQGAQITKGQRAEMAAWKAYREAMDDVPYETFRVPVKDYLNATIGYLDYQV